MTNLLLILLLLVGCSPTENEDTNNDTLSQIDVCLTLNIGDLNYISTKEIAGFQFNHNGCMNSAGGGDAIANGFTVSVSETVVIAFSFTGSVIPAGSGILVELGGDVTQDCLSDFVFSDLSGNPLEYNWTECD